MSHLFTSGAQSIGASASAPVLPMNIQHWLPLGWTGWISLQSKGLSRVFSNTTVQKHQFFGAQPSLWSNSHIPWQYKEGICNLLLYPLQCHPFKLFLAGVFQHRPCLLFLPPPSCILFIYNSYWTGAGLQCCVSFRWAAKWITVMLLLSHVWLFCDPMDCSPPGSSGHGISHQEY